MEVVHHSVTTSGLIADDHSLTITVPTNLEPGPVKVTVVLETDAEEYMPLSKLEELGVVGAWAHRQDIGDSMEFARRLRSEGWLRTG